MSNQRPAPGVTRFQLEQVPVKALNEEIGLFFEIAEECPDLREAHVDSAQHGNQTSSS